MFFYLNYGTWSCFRFSKRFLVLPMKVLLFFHSCQIVIHLCFAEKALIDSLFFQNFLRIPWIKNTWRINISTSDVLDLVRFFYTYPEVG